MGTGLWVFGYGSLIWDPGFPVAESQVARLAGWQRRFCMRSIHYRGTPDAPGLVLALDRAKGAQCDGLALRVAAGFEAAALAGLRERELISSAYLETRLPVELHGGGQCQALAYVVDPAHAQYCGGLSLDEQAGIIASSTGARGLNRDYLFATADHLVRLGIKDADLTWLAARVRALAGPEG